MDFVFILQQTIICMIPLLIVALGGLFSERSGVINLALDGEMIFGAFIGAIFVWEVVQNNIGLATSQGVYFLGMLVAALSGAVFSLLLSFSAIHLKANQTIGGTALNMLAPAIVCTFGLLFFNSERIVSGGSFILLKSSYPSWFQPVFDSWVGGFFSLLLDKVYLSTYVCVILFIVLSVWLYRSKVGTHLRACGEHPAAASSVGISVKKMRYLGVTISGALAGLGGFVYIATSAATAAENTVAGLGFLALAIMIFGNWRPLWIALGAFLFGFLKCLGVLSSQIDFCSKLGLPMYFYNMMPYIVVIIVLVLVRKKSGCPKAEGIPYEEGQR